MKIQYKHQKFQADAAKAVVDVFAVSLSVLSMVTLDRCKNPFSQTRLPCRIVVAAVSP